MAGPVGAAAGAFIGSMYEGQVQGSIHMMIRYLPIPPAPVKRKEYSVKGGMPGIDWGDLYRKYLSRSGDEGPSGLDVSDLESGNYFLRIQNGSYTAQKQFTKR